MHELTCPACSTPSQFDFRDYLLLCPFCSVTFSLDLETGQKDPFQDHYIIPNSSNPGHIKGLLLEWLSRLSHNHNASSAEKEFFVTDINGYSIPYWVVALEAHTVWKGLVKRQNRGRMESSSGKEYLIETGPLSSKLSLGYFGSHQLLRNLGTHQTP